MYACWLFVGSSSFLGSFGAMASDSQEIDFQASKTSKSSKKAGNCSRANDDEVDEGSEDPITLGTNSPRRTYLITYSQAQRSVFASRESFAKACAQALGGDKVVAHYACAEEPHADGGFHYHVAIKLNRGQRWGTAKKTLKDAGAIVNFQGPPGSQGMYAWMYFYISKYDKMIYHSEHHPTLDRIQSNQSAANANRVYRENRKRAAKAAQPNDGVSTGNQQPASKLSKQDVGEYCVTKGFKSLTDLLADAETRKKEGDLSLSSAVYSLGLKSVREVISTAWLMHDSVEKLKNLNADRMDVVVAESEKPCVPNCRGTWLRLALDILSKNNIDVLEYSHAVRTLLRRGRGKKRCLLLLGPGSTGKTFMLLPLTVVFPETFSSPAGSKFSWIGADECSIILLNDYRWYAPPHGNIEWSAFLQLLEGINANLPTPKNNFVYDIVIKRDTPVFATSPREIKWYATRDDEPRTEKHEEEDFQMSERWMKFRFSHKFTGSNRVEDVPTCGSCFCKLVLM